MTNNERTERRLAGLSHPTLVRVRTVPILNYGSLGASPTECENALYLLFVHNLGHLIIYLVTSIHSFRLYATIPVILPRLYLALEQSRSLPYLATMATAEPAPRPQGKFTGPPQVGKAGQSSAIRRRFVSLKLFVADIVHRQAFSPASFLKLDETPCEPQAPILRFRSKRDKQTKSTIVLL